MKVLKAALFDLDGTLVDSEGQYTQFWGEMGKEYHPEMPDFAARLKGTTLTNVLTNYFTPEQYEPVCKRLDEFEAQMEFPLIAGAEAFVKDLKSHGVTCLIVTSSNHAKLACLRKKQSQFLTLFDGILTAEDFKASKPDPDCYIRAAMVAEAERNECIVFEDAFSGLQAGMSSGIFTVGLATGVSREVLADKCHFVLDDFNGINYDKITKIWSR